MSPIISVQFIWRTRRTSVFVSYGQAFSDENISDFPVVHTGAHCAHCAHSSAHCAHCAHCQRASKSHFRNAFSVFLLHSVELLECIARL
jgi:hypothetical protein